MLSACDVISQERGEHSAGDLLCTDAVIDAGIMYMAVLRGMLNFEQTCSASPYAYVSRSMLYLQAAAGSSYMAFISLFFACLGMKVKKLSHDHAYGHLCALQAYTARLLQCSR